MVRPLHGYATPTGASVRAPGVRTELLPEARRGEVFGLGADMGTIGCVGVAEAHRGLRVGTAIVAAASETPRDRGVDNCHIGWTAAVNFYAGLGYRVRRS